MSRNAAIIWSINNLPEWPRDHEPDTCLPGWEWFNLINTKTGEYFFVLRQKGTGLFISEIEFCHAIIHRNDIKQEICNMSFSSLIDWCNSQ